MELNDAGANFTDDEIRDEVVTMMIGVSIFENDEICIICYYIVVYSDTVNLIVG